MIRRTFGFHCATATFALIMPNRGGQSHFGQRKQPVVRDELEAAVTARV
jgi:hypothetical protein